MILCICQAVSDRTVRLTVLNGARTVDEIGDRCGAGTDCGSCRHAIEDIVDEVDAHAAAAPLPCGGAYAESARHRNEGAVAVAASP